MVCDDVGLDDEMYISHDETYVLPAGSDSASRPACQTRVSHRRRVHQQALAQTLCCSAGVVPGSPIGVGGEMPSI